MNKKEFVLQILKAIIYWIVCWIIYSFINSSVIKSIIGGTSIGNGLFIFDVIKFLFFGTLTSFNSGEFSALYISLIFTYLLIMASYWLKIKFDNLYYFLTDKWICFFKTSWFIFVVIINLSIFNFSFGFGASVDYILEKYAEKDIYEIGIMLELDANRKKDYISSLKYLKTKYDINYPQDVEALTDKETLNLLVSNLEELKNRYEELKKEKKIQK